MDSSPPFCPSRSCPHNQPDTRAVRWFVRIGYYINRSDGRVQRFRCRHCGRSFSTQTFSVEYATHRRVDLKRLVWSLCSASGIRDVAREFGVSEKVILNRVSRLARQAMGLHCRLARHFALSEELVADGFESFVGSQYWPNAFTLLVGSDSQYLYSVDYAQLRRKGRMTDAQRRRRDALNRQVPVAQGQVERSFTRIVSEMGIRWARSPRKATLTLSTDRHRSYYRVITGDGELRAATTAGTFVHRRIDSRRPRTRNNPLFAVNYFDRELRKDMACHARETVQWSRDVNNAMDRMWLYGVWHNCFKPHRINGPDKQTHAERAGAPEGLLAEMRRHFFSRRFFFSRLSLSDSQWLTWLRGWPTPGKSSVPVVPAYVLA